MVGVNLITPALCLLTIHPLSGSHQRLARLRRALAPRGVYMTLRFPVLRQAMTLALRTSLVK